MGDEEFLVCELLVDVVSVVVAEGPHSYRPVFISIRRPVKSEKEIKIKNNDLNGIQGINIVVEW